MPELPEVETVKLGLQKYLVGHKILDIEIKVPKQFYGHKAHVIGAQVININRAGKGVLIELDNGYTIAIHLKMTGQLIYRDSHTQNITVSPKVLGGVPSKHTQVIFHLDKDAILYFNDIRKFGWIRILKNEEVGQLPFFKDMGKDPLIDLTLENFSQIISASNLAIKLLLMDQKKIGGIGNIYANEALYEADLDPRRKAKSLTTEEILKLYNSIRSILKQGIKYNGASDERFVDILGRDGHFQEHFRVYAKEGLDCSRCAGQVTKVQLGGRGTYYCPRCQK